LPVSRYRWPMATAITTETASDTAVADLDVSPRSNAASERSAAMQRIDEETPAKTSEGRDFLLPHARMPPVARAPA